MEIQHQPPESGLNELTARDSIRREMLRTNTAVGSVLVIVLALALAAVLSGARATRNRLRAEDAEAQGMQRLWNSYVAQGRALRLTAEAGRKQAALEAISNAAAIHPSPALRTEAVATLALSDLIREDKLVPIPKAADQAEMDAALEHFAYGDRQGNVFVCRLEDGAVVHEFEAQSLGPGTRLPVRSVAFSPDGKKLSARFAGGAVVVWDLATREQILATGLNATNLIVAGMSFTPDSQRLAFSDPDHDRQITLFDLTTRERVATAIRSGARTFRFRPGSMQVALATDNKVDLLDYPNETVLKTFTQPTRVFMHAWSPDGSQLAVTCEDGDVYLWEVDRGTQRLLRGHSEPCVRLGFSPDGKLLFTGSRDGSTRLWDAALGQAIVVASDGVAHTFSPDARRLGFWRMLSAFGAWRVADSDLYRLLPCDKTEGALASIDLSPSGRWCLAAQTKGIRFWDLAAGEREFFVPIKGLTSARFAADERTVYVCTTSELRAWSFPTTATAENFQPAASRVIPLPDGAGARGITLSRDERVAAVELTDLRLAIVDLHGQKPALLLPEKFRSPSAKSPGSFTGAGRYALSPDGRWLVTGYYLGPRDVPRVWDTQTGDVVATLQADTSVVAFSPDGKYLGLAGVGEFSVWSVGDWKRVQRIERDEPSYTHGSLAFSADGGQLAVTRTRQQVQLRQTLGEEKFVNFVAPVPQSVNSLRLSLNGEVLATASASDMIQIWRIGKIRTQLATMNLDWGQSPAPAANTTAVPVSWAKSTLSFGLIGVLLAAVISIVTLRWHHSAIQKFFTAEARAAARQRELEAARVELMHSQKMQALGTLATGIAHDFNNLLSVIRMSNKLVGRATKANPEIQEHVGDIEQAVLQGKNVVGSMLGYSRTEELVGSPTDAGAVVEEVVSLLSREFLAGLALTLEVDRHAAPVSVGRGRLEQILLNLVVNASEAMAGQGKLRISLHQLREVPARAWIVRPQRGAAFVELCVADSGPGIPAEIRTRIFEPFFTTKRAGAKPGTGLGLSLVYSIAEQEGLGLAVESEPGKGTLFAVLLPVVDKT